MPPFEIRQTTFDPWSGNESGDEHVCFVETEAEAETEVDRLTLEAQAEIFGYREM